METVWQTGKLAKADPLGAALLARVGALLELEALVKDQIAARNCGRVLTLSLLKGENAQRLDQIDRQDRARRSVDPPDQRSRRLRHRLAGLAPTARQSGALIRDRRIDVRPGLLHGSHFGCSLQSGHEDQVPRPHLKGRAGEGRPNRNHATARRPR